MKNIFYCSNANKELFSDNTRSSFNSYIDINNLNYLNGEDDIEVAIKSIVFNNTQSIHIVPNLKRPHFIIVQEISNVEDSHPEFLTSPIIKILESENSIEDVINVEESKDFIITNNCDSQYVFIASYEERSFSNVVFISKNIVIHQIYMHEKEYFILDTFIKHINNVLNSITFYHQKANIETDLIQKEYELHALPFKILINQYIAETLGINKEKKTATKLLDYFTFVEDCAKDSPANLFINDVYKFEYEMVYYEVDKDINPLQIHPKSFNSHIFGLRSNISDPSIRNNSYDNIISLFIGNETNDVEHVGFKNPPFFNTRKELLSRAKFQIIDVDTNLPPNFSTGSPTYIQAVIRKSVARMKKPFNIFLDSSCSKSKALYPKNNSMEFTIELPERLSFNRNWQVTLKSLFISNKILYLNDCYVRYFYYNWSKHEGFNLKELIMSSKPHSTIESFLKQFNIVLDIYKIKIRGEIVDGKVVLTYYEDWVEWQYSNTLFLSPHVAHILGFQKYDGSDKEYKVKFNKTAKQSAFYEPDLFFMYPKNLIIGCDVVDDTIFGGEQVKLLRLVTNNVRSDGDILSFDFLQNEYVNLNVKEFKSIKIAILDPSGSPVKTGTSFPTRLQLMFNTV